MSYRDDIFKLYSDIIVEDVQSSLNQARKILENNGIKNIEFVMAHLENIYKNVIFDEAFGIEGLDEAVTVNSLYDRLKTYTD